MKYHCREKIGAGALCGVKPSPHAFIYEAARFDAHHAKDHACKMCRRIVENERGGMIGEESPGAIRAAEIITGGTYGEDKRYDTTYGTKTVKGIAAIIDRHTGVVELARSCEAVLGWYGTSDVAHLMSEKGEQAQYHKTLREGRAAIKESKEGGTA